MNISRELWQQIDPLLTDALEMDDRAREAWLQSLEQTHPALTPSLRKILAAHDRAERSQELETVPKLAPAPPHTSGFAMGSRVGPFALLRLLGRGGMGEVWLANQVDGRIEREVALKLPTVYLHSGVWRERFRRERDILAKLAHPNIARLFDAGVSEEEGSRGQPYLAMEYIEGDSFSDYVATRKSDIEERLTLFRQVLAAVAHAHRHLVVHRDLKPANILVDQSGQVKLLDFGIAKLLDDGTETNDVTDLTRLGGRVMTLRFAAPEQVSDGVISTATDTYALGVILHELVTGLSPYHAVREGRQFNEVALLAEAAVVPSSLDLSNEAASERRKSSAKVLTRQINGDLDAIILKAMRRNPADRYASIEHFDEDIQCHLDNKPVKAREGTWRYLAGRFLARNKLPIATVAAVVVTMLAGLVMVEQQRRTAVAQRERAEKHFASVRKLANTFMFEVHDEIDTLQGALKAREMLVKTSLQYLDSLASEAGNDPSLAAELATAYRRIANIQGQPGAANLGMVGDSVANYEKGKALFVGLGNYKADDIAFQREHLLLRFTLARAYAQAGDPRWQENIQATVDLAARVASLPGATAKDRARVGGALGEQAHLTSILLGQSPEVEATIERAINQLEALARELPLEDGVKTNLASTYQRAADIYSGNHNTPASLAKAIDARMKAIDMMKGLATADPADQRFLVLIGENQAGLAENLLQAGKLGEAEQASAQALKLFRLRAAADPRNVGLRAQVMFPISISVRIAYQAGDIRKAIARGREGMAYFSALPERSRGLREIRSYHEDIKAYLGLALMAAFAKPDKAGTRNVVTLADACHLLDDSVKFLAEVRAARHGAFEEREAKVRLDGAATCRAMLAKV